MQGACQCSFHVLFQTLDTVLFCLISDVYLFFALEMQIVVDSIACLSLKPLNHLAVLMKLAIVRLFRTSRFLSQHLLFSSCLVFFFILNFKPTKVVKTLLRSQHLLSSRKPYFGHTLFLWVISHLENLGTFPSFEGQFTFIDTPIFLLEKNVHTSLITFCNIFESML